ncbi:MAG: glutamine--tRNA ligase/YqeY domain fusion protein [Saprospiraceae bacterium]|nr:glutamine--tRNA ligase/YqeY domain fusion protein [Saprospiraceae bacterium]
MEWDCWGLECPNECNIAGMEESKKLSLNFIEEIIEQDLAEKTGWKVHTRFPPEPNGYLHIGHAKSICLNFGIAEKYGGLTNLRFDDTNPTTEETEYVESIKQDIRWLGFDWEGREFYASDYFEILYEYAQKLIRKRLAYVDDSTSDEIAEQKGSPTSSGIESPYRNRSVEENLDLFSRMRAGEFEDGSKVLRAKIDMASPNMHLRDPVMYRIKKESHHRTGDAWCIYPMYDFAHGQSDSIEEITYSLCTLEFENHRPLYDWYIEALDIFPSRQIEFARLNVSYMVTSKRKLLQLVEGGHVKGWDDPRMPTIAGLRRRGYTPVSIRTFCDKVGIAKRENLIEMALLEFCVREDLNQTASRAMAVLDPVKVIIENIDPEHVEWLKAENNPEDPDAGSREVPFSREIFIERSDWMLDPPKKYFRLGPDRTVRLKHAYIIHCHDHILDANGNISEIRCTYYPDSKSGSDTSGIKAKGTLHWVSTSRARSVEVRHYHTLFTEPEPTRDEDKDFLEFLNPDSLTVVTSAVAEPALAEAPVGSRFQFLRKGYYIKDQDSTEDCPVFNLIVELRDSWKGKK